MTTATAETLSWYVVHTRPRQEERTNSNLLTLGIETLNPKLRVNKYNEFTGALIPLVRSLFPGYIFARFAFSEFYQRVKFTRGVHSLICFNNEPTRVDEEIIGLVRSRLGNDGLVKTTDDFNAGDEVIIKEGRFKNLCGVFEREMSDTDRVQVLLNAVSFQAHMVVDRSLLTRVTHENH